MKKLVTAIFAVCIAFALPANFLTAQTSDIQSKINDITRERDKLLQEQRQLQAQLDTLSSQSKSLQGNISTLNATKRKLENDIKITQTNISSANLQIDDLNDTISENERVIGDHQRAIAESVRQLNNYDGHTLVYDMLAYPTVSDVWDDQANLTSIQDKLLGSIAALRNTQIELAQNKANKEKQKSNLLSYQSQLSGQKKSVESTQQAKTELLKETKSQESQYQKLLAENKKREAEFEAQLYAYESQLKAAASGSAPDAERGILSWPISPVRITQQFGKTSSSGRLYASGTHNGMDFGASVGTAVKAASGGVVKAIGNTDDQKGCYSYGRWILLEHTNGLSTLYAHLSAAIVSQGQPVTAGQIIGYSGGQPGADGSGYSTGPHLHFGLFVTAGVSVQRYSTSINCKNVSIPIANPTDYLDPMAYLPK